MPEEFLPSNVQNLLQGALDQAEALQKRIAAGEDIGEQELTTLASLLATQMEQVRSQLEAVFGPIDPDALRARMKDALSPEEYEEWLIGENERLKLKAQHSSEIQLNPYGSTE